MKYFIFCSIILLFFSCSKSKTDHHKWYEDYKKIEKQIYDGFESYALLRNQSYFIPSKEIVRSKRLSCDVDIDAEDCYGIMRFSFSLFNYGDTIQLSKKVADNHFFNAYTTDNIYSIIEKQDVSIVKIDSIDKYGKYAFANITYNETILRNIFVSPLAYEYLHDYQTHDVLLLCCLYSNSGNRKKIVVYRAPEKARTLLENNPELVCTHYDYAFGCDDNWDKLRIEEN